MFRLAMAAILVVEDEMLIRLHVADTLRDFGFDVVEAGDGRSAIEQLRRGKPVDAVFTDVSLPGETDGFAIARWVRKNLPGVPVILTSGEVTDAHAQKVSRDVPFFAKPCDYAQVAAFIRGLLEKKPAV